VFLVVVGYDHKIVFYVNCVAEDPRAVEGPYDLTGPDVPKKQVIVSSSAQQLVLGNILHAIHSVLMPSSISLTRKQRHGNSFSLVVEQPNRAVLTPNSELNHRRTIVDSEELRSFVDVVMNLVPTLRMPMRNHSLARGRNQNIFGFCRVSSRPPSQRGYWELALADVGIHYL
jgi:hypothetical protein